jgi:Tfp pilus assembly protein PilN
MKNIDFLPSRYREGYAARAAIIKRWTIVLGLATIITPLAIYQYLIHASVVQSFVHVEPEYLQAKSKAERIGELQQELQVESGKAALLSWLNHPWPRSQILAQITAPLPESVRLTSIKMASEPKPVVATGDDGRGRAPRPSADPRETAVVDARPEAERDLLKLYEQSSQNDVVVTINGVTVSTTELHTYVAKMRVTGMFVKSELRSLESMPGQENSKAQSFEIRLVLAPGHALLPKPTAAGAAAPVANGSAANASQPGRQS